MGIFQNIMLGNALTKLTTMFEEINNTKHTHPIGAGGGVDSLPIQRQNELERKLPKWLNTLKKHPRHVITAELLKNIRISIQLHRVNRQQAQWALLERLVELDLAMDLATFEKSYL